MKEHIELAITTIVLVIGCILLIIIYKKKREELYEFGAIILGCGGFMAMAATISTGINLNNELHHYRERNKPTIEDVSANRAMIDTTYTIHKNKIDTTYSIEWIGRKTGARE